LAKAAVSSPTPHLVIRPSRGLSALNLRELWQYRDLLFTLGLRDVKIRYKQTALGVVWVVLQPLLAAGIFSFVFGRVAKMPTDGVPAFIFSYAGLLGWNLFANTLTRTSGCLVGNSHLISKVFFPRLILPISTLGSVLVDSGVAACMMALILALNGIMPGWQLFLLPLWVVLLLMLALGIGLWAAALTVSYRDVQYVLPVAIQMGLYASPVAYSVAAVPERYRSLYYLNPLAGLMDAFRWSVLGVSHRPEFWPVAYSTGVAVGLLVLGSVMFKKMERKFADVI
jgi:lipopolysaccharide transport system permease protein